MRGGSKKVVGASVIARDISRQKEIERVKNELASRLSLATTTAKIGIWDWDIVHNVLLWDEQMYLIFGVKKKDFTGGYGEWLNTVHPDDRKRADEEVQIAIRGKKSLNSTFRIVTADGEIRYLRSIGDIQRDSEGKPIKLIGVNWDCTLEKTIDIHKTEFVSLASHQLKTPVGALSWNIEMLLDGDYGPINSQQKKVLSGMSAMNRRMNDLIDGLLNISRIEMGVFIIEPVLTNFSKICDQALSEMKKLIQKKQHRVIKVVGKKLPEIKADPRLLKIIFQNLISNAIKYTPNRGKITISIRRKKKEVLISVANNGAPIPAKDQSGIFTKLFRADNAQIQDPDGNGLGLYIVKKIVENGGGGYLVYFRKRQKYGFLCFLSDCGYA